MSRLVRGTQGVRTITFPSTVKEVLDGAFKYAALLAVVMNEGLEKLGEYQGYFVDGVFSHTWLR